MASKPQVYVMASGSKTGGGSGFQNLVVASRRDKHPLNYEVAGVVCNIRGGGVEDRAKRLGIPFFHFEGEVDSDGVRRWDANHCCQLIGVEHPRIMMSGWLKVGRGYSPRDTINIHPGPTRKNAMGVRPFAGKGMYGHHVHETVLAAYERGEVSHTEVTIHAVTDIPDAGAPIARFAVRIHSGDTVEVLADRVNEAEHCWQPIVMEAWLAGKVAIDWEGLHATSPFPH